MPSPSPLHVPTDATTSQSSTQSIHVPPPALTPIPTPTSTIHTFLSHIKTKNTQSMQKMIHPAATACLIRNSSPRFMTLREAIDNLDKTDSELVEVTSDEAEHVDDVHVTGDNVSDEEGSAGFAVVWARFKIWKDGELHQIGSSSFSLYKSPESGSGWIILSMNDIARSP